jgi:hypothetical protein
MTQEELRKIKDFYEQVILQQIIKPIEINEVYCIIHPEELNPRGVAYKLKQRAISVFVQTKEKEVLQMLDELFTDKTTTNEPKDNPSIHIDNCSHEESQTIYDSQDEITDKEIMETLPKNGEVLFVYVDDVDNPTPEDKIKLGIADEITRLMEIYQTATDTNVKRSITQKINKLKKQLESLNKITNG